MKVHYNTDRIGHLKRWEPKSVLNLRSKYLYISFETLVNVSIAVLISFYIIGHLALFINSINYFNPKHLNMNDPFAIHRSRYDDENDWSVLKNRDVNLFILPNSTTVINGPDDIFFFTDTRKNKKLLLLLIVCTPVNDFSRRKHIRKTWGNYRDYLKSTRISDYIKARYKKFNDSAFAMVADKEFDPMYLPNDFTYNLNDSEEDELRNPEFKVVFLTGIQKNEDSYVQYQLEVEIGVYQDIIQENFVDTYRNLTLKSLMMLKWVKNNCLDSVRYVAKVDGDMYLNMPNLMRTLRQKSGQFDERAKPGRKEYLIFGHLHHGHGPTNNAHHRFYTPIYLFQGSKFPRYLSGSCYVMSVPAVVAIFEAAQNIPFLNMEDVYITGLCTQRSQPRLRPYHDYQFVNHGVHAGNCDWHDVISAEQRDLADIRSFHERGMRIDETNSCEVERLFKCEKSKLVLLKEASIEVGMKNKLVEDLERLEWHFKKWKKNY